MSLAGGRWFSLDSGGRHDQGLLDGDARRQTLVEEFGSSQEIAGLLPADEPVTP